MTTHNIFEQIEQHFSSVVRQDSELGKELWEALIRMHPADIGTFLANLNKDQFSRLFLTFPIHIKSEIFHYLSDTQRAFALQILDDQERATTLSSMSMDEFTDLVDFVSEKELRHYFKLIKKKDREKVVSLMKFSAESAGGVMDINVITLPKDQTVSKAVQLLQKLQPSKEIHDVIYVIGGDQKLVGYINLEDLVTKSPNTPISDIVNKNEYVANVDEDREEVAQKMLHYHLTTVPVVSRDGVLLGVIPSETRA